MSEVTFDFSGKNFAVTGASSGIGKQVALELLSAGANVFAVARRKELLDEIYKDYPDQVVTARLDVTKADGWDSALKDFVKAKGKFNGSVYAAGITTGFSLRLFDDEKARTVMETNFFGAVSFLRRLTRSTNAASQTSNVWIASTAAHCGARSLIAYGSTKGALISAMRHAACEIGKNGHRLNTISPGWVDTEMTHNFLNESGINLRDDDYILGIGKPEDISGVILFLLSNRSRWITGTDIVVDGGLLAS